ncbi:MAG TPA: ABC transporter ATP-binding protein [Candidatus Eisenbacteria bacterium]
MSAAVSAAAPAVTASLSARDLTHRYSPRRGLERVSFELQGPRVAAVTGPNGSGKSTLLRIVAGLLRPSGGTCTLECGGRPIAPQARRDRIGLASPELSFYEELTAGENLMFAAAARGLDDARGRVRRALERVGLWARAGDRADALSSGMRQRLRLAFALLHEPPVLLLDEPGSHLDDDGRAMVARIVDEHRGRGLVLVATNDEREWRLAEQAIHLRGRGLGDPA